MWRIISGVCLVGASGYYAVNIQRQNADPAQKSAAQMTLKERFQRYAHGPSKDALTIDEFIASVSTQENEKEMKRPSHPVRKLFKTLDADGDNQLSYEEYCAFFSLISNRDDLFRVAFTMFDRDNNGHLDVKEFAQVMKALCVDPDIDLDVTNSNIATYFFGAKKDKTLSYNSFINLVHQLRWELRRAEFEQFDRNHPGLITLADLRQIVFKGESSKSNAATKKDSSSPPADNALWVTWATYRKLFEILLDADRISRAMELYQEAKSKDPANSEGDDAASVDRVEFGRALRCGAIKHISPDEVDLFFRLFDTDGSNSVSPAEFQEICNVRNAFYATAIPKFDEPKRTVPQQFLYCMAQRV